MRAPLQIARRDWDTVEDPPLADVLPYPIQKLVLDARAQGLAIAVSPLDRLNWCGYSLRIEWQTIHVTGPAGLLYPYELSRNAGDGLTRQCIAKYLDIAEPPDVIEDFESRYLAGATSAAAYKAFMAQMAAKQ